MLPAPSYSEPNFQYFLCSGVTNYHFKFDKNNNKIQEFYVGFDMSQAKLKIVSRDHNVTSISKNLIKWKVERNDQNILYSINTDNLILSVNNKESTEKYCYFLENEDEFSKSLLKEKKFEVDKLKIY